MIAHCGVAHIESNEATGVRSSPSVPTADYGLRAFPAAGPSGSARRGRRTGRRRTRRPLRRHERRHRPRVAGPCPLSRTSHMTITIAGAYHIIRHDAQRSSFRRGEPVPAAERTAGRPAVPAGHHPPGRTAARRGRRRRGRLTDGRDLIVGHVAGRAYAPCSPALNSEGHPTFWKGRNRRAPPVFTFPECRRPRGLP